MHVLDDHFVFRDGTRLIHTQRIDARKRLDAVQLMHQRLALRKTHHACDERKARQQIQSLRDHADDGADGRCHGDGRLPAQPDEFLDEHDDAQRNDDHADPLDQTLQRAHHFGGLRLFGLFRLQRQTRDVGVRADGGQPRAAETADDEAAGEELVAGLLFDLVRLACDERLVHVARPVRDHGVGVDLVPGCEHDDIVAHERVGADRAARTVAYDDGFWRGEDVQLFKRALRADLLHDADGRVDDDDPHEREVQPLLHGDDAQRQQEEDHVEVREYVAENDLLDGLAGRIDGCVGPAALRPFAHLFGGQAGFRVGLDDGNLLPNGQIVIFLFRVL